MQPILPAPSLGDLFGVFGRIGLLSFGGPAAQISLMHRELVEKRQWLDEEQFLGALSFCMMLPGPEAMQLATYAGWRLRGTPGGLIAGLLFVLPGAAVIALLGAVYIGFGDLPGVRAGFLGVQAAIVAVVIQALLRLSRRVLRNRRAALVALGAFAGLFSGLLPFPVVVIAAGCLGFALGRDPATKRDAGPLPGWRRTLPVVLGWAALWAAPLVLLALLDAGFLLTLGLFFSKLAIVGFGGAYAVLAYMVQAVVTEHQWLTTHQMMDALGLAETTPGPLILVTQFVGQIAGHGAGGAGMAALAGLITLWCTFVPCFLWIFTGAPYVEAVLRHPRLTGALALISAAIVGVIASLGLWFALHVLFGETRSGPWGTLPVFDSFEPAQAALVLLGAALLFLLRLPLVATLAATALSAILWAAF
ncbi:chromate efflux transporter [Shimia sp.]|uniref:chromate efflux transporter n=1 Tax=Shimia sp. TaxID=1954381 RepID=UPI00356A062B